ncbi:ATP-grasp domain-containing protein [Ruania alba]|nr:ATP-grasp domain-containing protein [Ruania alba]
MNQNVFVLGLDEANAEVLRSLDGADSLAFHQLLTRDELQQGEVNVPDLLDRAEVQLTAFDGTVDAIVNFWDFPATMMAPILCARRGLPSADLGAVVRCEHKYWSRLVQSRVTNSLPAFGLLDLDADEPHLPDGVSYPAWIKPVESASSEGAYRVADQPQLADVLPRAREDVTRMGRPFEDVLAMLHLPPEIEQVGGTAYMAEEVADGHQMTLEGFVADGTVTAYGLVASINYPDSSSFLRYQYPAPVPLAVRDRIVEISTQVIAATGLDTSTFNIEYFWDPETGRIRLLEINARHSQEHARLFEMVDGVPNHAAMVRLGLGQVPDPPRGERRRYPMAAKWFLRHFSDGIVRRVPDESTLARLEERLDGSVHVRATEGTRLSAGYGEDSYSYVLAEVFVGGEDEEELRRKYDEFRDGVEFEIDDVEEA